MINYAVQRDRMINTYKYFLVDTPGGATAIVISQTGMRVTVASPSVSYCVHMVFRTEHWRSSLNRYNVHKHRMDYYTGNVKSGP